MPDTVFTVSCSVCRSEDRPAMRQVGSDCLCPPCFDQLRYCARCQQPAVTLIPAAGEAQVCPTCVAGSWPCVSCQEITGPGLHTDTDDPVCHRCAYGLFDSCFGCNRFSASSRYLSGGYRACAQCAATRYRECGECGTLLRENGSCDLCAHPGRVRSYSYKPDPRFLGEGPLYLGLELEVIVPDDRYSDAVAAATSRLGRLGYLKKDSSIQPTGFELVTHPLSYRFAIEDFPWTLLGELDNLGCTVDDTVGLHVHASRAGFASPAHVYRWMKLLYRNEAEVAALARRRSRYAPFDHVARARARDTAKDHKHAVGLDRYQAINPHPRHTLELRVFASSLDVGQVQAALAFTAASIAYTRHLTIGDIRSGGWDWSPFAEWVADRSEYAPLTVEMEALACAC
ncbi:hypothetical protein AB0H42_30230 [Nocardia sp. NPDC050799]|uniref:hypothetical protein n=1 Tax=Nocardia sp. NPDC050799 TaxID=3154842 RepID=UPI0033CA126B